MFRLILFTGMVAMAYCTADCGSLTAWSKYETAMKAFLTNNAASMTPCYSQSGCPDPTSSAVLKGNPIFDSGCSQFATAGNEAKLNCTAFYTCVNNTGTSLTKDSLSCVQNKAPTNKLFKFPTADFFQLEFGFGNYGFTGTCNVTTLLQCITNTPGLKTSFCDAAKAAVNSYFTGCTAANRQTLASSLSTCLNTTYTSKYTIYASNFGICMPGGLFGQQTGYVNKEAVKTAMNAGFASTALNFPTDFCGIS